MKILCVGGGSGGHITPIVAVIEQLKSVKYGQLVNQNGELELRVWCDRKFVQQAKSLLDNDIRVDVIAAGKLRRYANLKWWYRWFSPWHIIHTHIPNLIDLFRIMAGFIQSLWKLLFWRPDVVFCKGGFVCMPVGIVARLYHIPLVIHDSDTVPGLTNRILARYATAIGTGAPVESYPTYPKAKTKFIGVPVRSSIKTLNAKTRQTLKSKLKLDAERPLVLITGGGLGSVAMNTTAVRIATKLVKLGCQVVLQTGKGNAVDVPTAAKKHFQARQFLSEVSDYIQACDIAVTRAGATTMAELATASVPTIIIPSPYLSGDHQTKNANVYQQAGAAVVINEFELKEKPELLLSAIADLLDNNSKRAELAKNLHKFARPNALADMVDMIINAAKSN